MPYTVNTELGKPNQRGERKVYLLIITDGKKLPRIDTEVRITTTLKKAPESAKNIISKKRMEIEAKLL